MRITLSTIALATLLATPALAAKGQTSTLTCDPAPCGVPPSGAAQTIDAEAAARADLSGMSLNTAAVAASQSSTIKRAPAPAPVQPPKDEPTPFHPLTDF